MADVVVPQLGESITEAVVAKWLKNVGDAVAADEPIAELETDKITVTLPSPTAGALTAQSVQPGATVKVGQVIGSVEPGKAGTASAPAAKADAPAPKAAAAPAAKPATPPPAPAAAKAASPAPPAAAAAAPATPKTANGHTVGGAGGTPGPAPGLDKDALLKLTPSQRATVCEYGLLFEM